MVFEYLFGIKPYRNRSLFIVMQYQLKKHFVSIVLVSLSVVIIPSSCVWNAIEDPKDPDYPLEPAVLAIQSIDPEAAAPGEIVRILGSGFSVIPSENIVRFGDLEAEIDSASTTRLVVKIPVGAETAAVEVVVNNKSVTAAVFIVLPDETSEPENPESPEEPEEPESPETPDLLPYYIKFKFKGELKVFQESDPEFQDCYTCLCSFTPAHAEPFSDLAICSAQVKTAGDILALKGATLTFQSSGNGPVFGFTENDVTRSSSAAIEQEGSWVKITDVEADGETATRKGFKVSGNFQCKVKDID
jgi:hypothetical protein